MDLASAYEQILARDGFRRDPAQLELLAALQGVANAIERQERRVRLPWSRRKAAPARGLFIWGGVGRGKTWLMDLFFDQLREQRRQRLHFHRFMQEVHAQLGDLRQSNPLQIVARRMARQWRVLCLDEFNVTDIADAMILAGLLRALLAEGVVLVTTSNVPPEDLYRDGLQRASFLPAIDLLSRELDIVHMGGGRDYRCEVMRQQHAYHWPLGVAAEDALAREFGQLAGGEVDCDGALEVNGRRLPYRRRAEGVVWFDFEALCGPPRSQLDYIELARTQAAVFLSDVPRMGSARDDRTRRFIFLIDEFYDRRVKLVMSADAAPERLYSGERLAFEFQRTASRLAEMQTEAYLGSPHRG